MPKKSAFFKPLSILLLLTGIASPMASAEDKPIAIINGDPVTSNELSAYIRATAPQANLNEAAIRQQVLQGYIGRELLYQEAIANKIDKNPNVQAALEEQRHTLISQALVAELFQKNPVTEEQMRSFYKKEIAGRHGQEYQTSHILTSTQDDAKAALARLKKGEAFDKVAKELSKDSSAKSGGKLGWLPADKMPAGFGEAVKKTAKGKYTTTPVKTDFGWHIIKVEDSRKIQPPPFEAVQNQITQVLREKAVNQYLEKLQKKAKVEVK